MTSQTAREALIEELAAAIRRPLPDFPYSTRLSAASAILPIITRDTLAAYHRGLRDAAAICDEVASVASARYGEYGGYAAQTAAQRIRERLP